MNVSVANHVQHASPLYKRNSLVVSLATSTDEVNQCLKLRHRIFAEELGAKLHSTKPGLDYDEFDDHARHLFIRDTSNNEIVATTRLISNQSAELAGGFYSEHEFDLSVILNQHRNLLEIGRTCIAESYRNGAALALLWQGIARIANMENIDYLIGCASIPINGNFSYAHAIMKYLRENHSSELTSTIHPLHDLPEPDTYEDIDVILPTLIKGYVRLGAEVSAEACYDHDFKVADVFILLDNDCLKERYRRHFTRV
jgi:putative hemolysin